MNKIEHGLGFGLVFARAKGFALDLAQRGPDADAADFKAYAA